MNGKVMVVDDTRLNLLLMEQILEDYYYDVYLLSDALDIINQAIDIQPDVILLDIMMPIVDGFTACQQLKECEDTRNIPVIMVTAKSNEEDVSKAFDMEVLDYIKKPVQELELISRVKSAIRISHQQKKLEEYAMRDSLTGLYNHRLLKEMLQKEWDLSIRHKRDMAFAMIDIDKFKNVNDTYGHPVGDIILKETGKVLTEQIRNSDIVARYGGEEFAIIFTDVNDLVIHMLGERLRKAIEEYAFIADNKPIPITVSIGICLLKMQGNYEKVNSIDEMVRLADEKLYGVKKNGRNGVGITTVTFIDQYK